nr:invasion associated locus B family protein [Bradyrhizobium japonicum]
MVVQFLEKHSATATPSGQVSSSSLQQEPQAKPPRLRLPENIHYSNWEKFCFDSSDGTTICRTTSTGTDDLDQVVVRVDLIQRADGPARLQLFVPQGANLQQGVKVTVDQGSSTQVPFNWCLSNICIAARGIESTLTAQMEAGRQLKLELTDLDASSVAISLPLEQFASVHKAQPAKTFDFTSDEE